jgi:hypothetical protein
MMALCTLVIIGMWLEHYLLLGPALSSHGSGHGLPVSPVEAGVALGFAGLLMLAVFGYLRQFPDLLASGQKASE